MSEQTFDLIVVGRGPVGLSMAALAAQAGLGVALIERHRDLYGLPRAGHVDHEIVRLLQNLGVAGPLLEDSYPTTEYVWMNAQGEMLLEFDWGAKGISGYNSDYMQFQPVFENALCEKLTADRRVTQFLSWEAQDLEERGDRVALTIARTIAVRGESGPVATDEKQTIAGRYLIAADGAGSAIRRRLGIEREDLGFNEKWLVIDARKKREIKFDFDCGQICDPRRPVTVLPLGRRHRRWEWALLPGETAAEMEKPETGWELLAKRNITPDDVEIVRQLVYTFEARHATTWRKGRVFLMGDAAHTTPPFVGQGMCSGMRDAKNLVWKLDLVTRGICDEAILDTYEAERSPHTKDWTLISLEAGKVPCTTDPEEARRRDQRFREGWRPPMPDFPKIRSGIVARSGPTTLPGELGLQARVRRGERVELFDEFYPSDSFAIVSTVCNPAEALLDAARHALERIGVRYVHVGAGGDVGDVDGAYARYFAEHGIEAVINRPDFYVFGGARKLENLPELASELLHALRYLESAEPVARRTAIAS